MEDIGDVLPINDEIVSSHQYEEEDTNEVDPNEDQEIDSTSEYLTSQPDVSLTDVSSTSDSFEDSSGADSGAVVPVVPQEAIKQLVDDWIKKKNTVADTIMNTNLLIQNLPGEAFEKHVDTITNILEQAKDADGVPIFKNRADITDYIYKIRNNRKKQSPLKQKMITIPQRLQDDVSLENRYSRMISPLMKRNILSNSVRRSNLFAFQ